MSSTLQITIRGLDQQTKAGLVSRARSQGLSLNKYALKTLRQGAGVDSAETRFQAMRQFLETHPILDSKAEQAAFDEALDWSNKVSLAKQQRDEHEISH